MTNITGNKNVLHERYPPLSGGHVRADLEQREADQRDGGRDGQGPDVPQDEAHDAREADHHLKHRGHHNGALDLWPRTSVRVYQNRKIAMLTHQ